MSIELYEHNKKAYDSAKAMLALTGKAAVVHPTGTGKSFIGFKLCEDNADKTVCWIGPSEYIFKTQTENLKACAGEELKNIRFFTYARLMNMTDGEMEEISPDFIVLDEFHRGGAERWGEGLGRLLKKYRDAPVLGLSATNIRYLDDRRDMAEELFDGNVSSEMTLGEAVARGILTPPKYVTAVYSYKKDLERYERAVKRIKNEGRRKEAEIKLEALRRALEMADGLDTVFEKNMNEKYGKYIVFCANKEHMDDMIEKAGEWFKKIDRAPHIYSVYSEDPSSGEEFGLFKKDNNDTHLRLLYCIDALNEGIHVDNVNGVILLRPTVSPIIYKQQIGRALCAGKSGEPVIFDIVNNIEGLYSVDSIEEEISRAVRYYEFLGETKYIVNDRFGIIDSVEDCRRLFEELEHTLSASWEYMYGEAKEYEKEHGDLLPRQEYVTENGARLGRWISVQRINYGNGTLSEERIRKLEQIGMSWLTLRERRWDEIYEQAKKYYEENGSLKYSNNMSRSLAEWLIRQRQKQREGLLSKEQFKKLSDIGMIWEFEDSWEKKYELAKKYYEDRGDLDIPANYVTEDGVKLGAWYRGVRERYADGALGEDRKKRLEDIGIEWESILSRNRSRYYELAKKYYEENGDLNVNPNYVTEDGTRLGAWISAQRYAYKKQRLTKEQIKLLEDIGMSWQRNESRWETAYECLRAYREKNEGTDISSDCVTEDGFKLGSWLNNQRRKYAAGKLKPAQIKKLEALGITLNTSDRKWREGFEHARAYYSEHGNLDVAASYTDKDGFRLGNWLMNQRARSRAGTMSEEQQKMLDGIGMRRNLRDRRWQEGYIHAKAYFEKFGNLNVPKNFVCEDGYSLYEWIISQRRAYRNKTLSEDRNSLLCEIGMIRNTNDSRWSEVYETAREYYREHGDLDVPLRYKAEDGSDLWEWVRLQREKYYSGTLSADCKRKLDEIGIQWLSVNERKWERCYDEAKKYYLSHGNIDVPNSYRSEDGLWLGKWIARQRKNRNRLKTAGANGNQILRLEEIGMRWEEQTPIRITHEDDRGSVTV